MYVETSPTGTSTKCIRSAGMEEVSVPPSAAMTASWSDAVRPGTIVTMIPAVPVGAGLGLGVSVGDGEGLDVSVGDGEGLDVSVGAGDGVASASATGAVAANVTVRVRTTRSARATTVNVRPKARSGFRSGLVIWSPPGTCSVRLAPTGRARDAPLASSGPPDGWRPQVLSELDIGPRTDCPLTSNTPPIPFVTDVGYVLLRMPFVHIRGVSGREAGRSEPAQVTAFTLARTPSFSWRGVPPG